MEARLDALKAKFRKYAAPVLATFALSGGMAAPTQAGGVSDVLDGVVDEIKTQTEQRLRGTVQRATRRADEQCRTNRSSRSGNGDSEYNQGALSQNCRELTYEDQLRREINRTNLETRLLQQKERQQRLLNRGNGQQGHGSHHHHRAPAKQEISLSEYYNIKNECMDAKLLNGEAEHVRDADGQCTKYTNDRFTLNY
jgi:hypothetical protein